MGPLMASDDDVRVEPVEVVLVHQDAVAGASQRVPLGDAVGPAAAEVPEVREADAREADRHRDQRDADVELGVGEGLQRAREVVALRLEVVLEAERLTVGEALERPRVRDVHEARDDRHRREDVERHHDAWAGLVGRVLGVGGVAAGLTVEGEVHAARHVGGRHEARRAGRRPGRRCTRCRAARRRRGSRPSTRSRPAGTGR